MAFDMGGMLFLVVLGSITLVSGKDVDLSDIQTTIQELFNKTLEAQNQRDKPFIPFLQWAKKKGLFDSQVKMNFHGQPDLTVMRDLFEVYDNNMFATSWITTALMEAYKYGAAPKPPEETIIMALEGIGKFYDHNRNYDNSLYSFWLPKYNETVKTWQAHPENMLDMFEELNYINWVPIFNWLDNHGLENIAKIIQQLLNSRSMYEQVFLLPPDFDDTFVNIGVGSLLATMSDEYPNAFKTWKKQNSNVTSVIDSLKHYAYRPFGAENRSNIIDCRTYYYLRHFLNHTITQTKTDVAFVPTWVQDVDDLKTWYYRGVIMPININNVDVTVSSNALFGLTNGVMNGIFSDEILKDADLFKIYNTTLNLISYEIQHNFTSRPDLALLYYPSKWEFYWFVARTYFTIKDTNSTLIPNIKQVRDELKIALKSRATPAIVSEAKTEPDKDLAYFDDFLGNDDINMENKTVNHAQDRIYTTAMAVNALTYIWTTYNKTTGKLSWDADTSDDVKTIVKDGVNWLTQYTLSGDYMPWNTFFSGSYKGYTTGVSSYPVNRVEYINGTVIPDHADRPHGGPSYFGVQGYINEAEYEQMETEKHLGHKTTPTVFNGFNADPNWFPFWSSKTYAHAAALVSLSHYVNIQ